MLECGLCPQKVINIKERQKQKPLCYYHAKVRDGLIVPEPEEEDYKWGCNTAWDFVGAYQPFVFKQAYNISKRYGVPTDDMKQEGLKFLYEIGGKLDTTKTRAEQVSYLMSTIRGRMLNYVGELVGVVTLSKRQYQANKKKIIQAGFKDQIMFHDSQLNPEQMLIQKERGDALKSLADQFRQFSMTLNKVERVVMQRHMVAKKPWAQKTVAQNLNINQATVSRIKDRIQAKAREYFKEKENK